MKRRSTYQSLFKSFANLLLILLLGAALVTNHNWILDSDNELLNFFGQVDFDTEVEEKENKETADDKVQADLLGKKICRPNEAIYLHTLVILPAAHLPDTPTPPPEIATLSI